MIVLDGTSGITSPSATVPNTFNSSSTFGFKSRIINGNMAIDQRNAGASVTNGAATTTYCVDRWSFYGTSASKFSVQQNAGGVTAPVGFSKYLGFTSLASTTVSAGDYYYFAQYIEGFNSADLGFGTANAKTITISFQVYSSITGTFSGSLGNSAYNRAYPFTYSIPVANTWTTISVTVVGDTSGTWVGATNGTGIVLYLNLGSGSNNLGTAGSWAGSGNVGATGSTGIIATNGATFYITGVQLEKGSTATSFDYRPYGTELALCQRYCFVWNSTNGSGDRVMGFADSTTNSYAIFKYPVQPRVKATGIIATTSTNFRVGNPSTTGAPTAIAFTVAGEYQVLLSATTTAGSPTLASGNVTQLFANTTTCQIEFTGMEL